jgi:hypothetical protein
MRVAENNPVNVRMAKLQMNKAQDMQGYSSAPRTPRDYLTMSSFGAGVGRGRPPDCGTRCAAAGDRFD